MSQAGEGPQEVVLEQKVQDEKLFSKQSPGVGQNIEAGWDWKGPCGWCAGAVGRGRRGASEGHIPGKPGREVLGRVIPWQSFHWDRQCNSPKLDFGSAPPQSSRTLSHHSCSHCVHFWLLKQTENSQGQGPWHSLCQHAGSMRSWIKQGMSFTQCALGYPTETMVLLLANNTEGNKSNPSFPHWKQFSLVYGPDCFRLCINNDNRQLECLGIFLLILWLQQVNKLNAV